MKPRELKVARIGNSRGIRLPADTLERYHIGDSVIMEERADGILLQPRRTAGGPPRWLLSLSIHHFRQAPVRQNRCLNFLPFLY